MNQLRVVLIESELSDARFVQEALAEVEETTHGGTWLHCRVTHLDRLDDALLVVPEEQPDIIMFSPKVADSLGMETFSRLRDAAPGVPLIALLERGEEGLGRRMLREGAQDYLLKGEIDCEPLARTMMNAIERHRFVRATLRCIQTDPQTGLQNSAAFDEAAAREALLARGCNRSLSLLLAEIDNLEELDGACGRGAVQDTVVQAANVLRHALGETALLARTGPGAFAVLDWNRTADELIHTVQRQIAVEHQPFAFVFGHAAVTPCSHAAVGDAMRAACQALCENKLAYSNLT